MTVVTPFVYIKICFIDRNSPPRPRGFHPIACLKSTCPQTEINDRPVIFRVTRDHHVETLCVVLERKFSVTSQKLQKFLMMLVPIPNTGRKFLPTRERTCAASRRKLTNCIRVCRCCSPRGISLQVSSDVS